MTRVIVLLLLLFSVSAHSNIESASAICISLQTGKGIEHLVYTAFASKVCGKYSNNLQIIFKHSESEYPVTDKERTKIRSFLKASKKVDIFFFGHTNDSSLFFVNDFKEYLSEKIRLVYNSGCLDGDEFDVYRWKGYTKVFVGHPEYNYGVRYTPYFLKKWFKGLPVKEIVKLSNERMNKDKYFEEGNDPYGYVYGDETVSIND